MQTIWNSDIEKAQFPKNGHIIWSGKVKFEYGKSKEEIRALMADYNQRRRDKQPLNFWQAPGTHSKGRKGVLAESLLKTGRPEKDTAVGGANCLDKHADSGSHHGYRYDTTHLAAIAPLQKLGKGVRG